MIRKTIRISNKLGLHARASAKLTKLAGSFRSEVFMSRNGRRVNAKSIMGVMMLAAGMGSQVDIEVEGVQTQPVIDRDAGSDHGLRVGVGWFWRYGTATCIAP